MSLDRPLLDRPIPAVDRALAELLRIRLAPLADRERGAEAKAKQAIASAMISARVARYQTRTADGEVAHLSIELPEPRVSVSFSKTTNTRQRNSEQSRNVDGKFKSNPHAESDTLGESSHE